MIESAFFIDLHCHILPNIDDGAKSMDVSVAMARRYVEAGFGKVVATPHFIKGTAWASPPDTVVALVEQLQHRLDSENIALQVYVGMEIADHPHLLDRVGQGSLLSLAGSKAYLLEPSFQGSQHKLLINIKTLLERGYKVVLAHAERCPAFQKNMAQLLPLVDQGLHIQINASSLLEDADTLCKKTAMSLLESDSVHYLASDAHDLKHRSPPSRGDLEWLEMQLGRESLIRLWATNPAKLLTGE
ncbi:hypothetical protein JWJ90_00105 [Desulfobulbus rhabdoformis]|uniref:tyrosine-protein phosphatase n=1 Tax=Desulfobulbus rhabdoformis TaxID=34032 RepID=UPI0019635500|nr:CpsB/CapC family capsule biosynthesis tyrosine phosphatase [Desulfobulbus rhabdoformis]MBM9612681.1 hypothetical protein [Desulfobulbus rhabdoformis]